MALVTLQRSPSPSNDPDEETAEGGEDGVDHARAALRHKRSKSTLERLRKIFSTVRFISKLRPCLSESYFTVKGAALILPHNDLNRKASKRNHGGEIQRHLQSMLYLLRPEDKIKVAIRLEKQGNNDQRYLALVSTIGRQDTEESVILGLDCAAATATTITSPTGDRSSTLLTTPTSPGGLPPSPVAGSDSGGAAAVSPCEGRSVFHSMATIGLVLPLWMGMKVRLSGDGGFSISLDDRSYIFKPVSVQAMWSAIQSVDKALRQAEQMKYLHEGLTHTWVEYYRSKVDTSIQTRQTSWNLIEDVQIFAPTCLTYSSEVESEKLKLKISAKLKEVMMSVDLEEATSLFLRKQVEKALNMDLKQYRSYFDEELLRILGQLDSPSQILDFLYLGSEWNASNLEELQSLGIKYILNTTREIDNFFTGMFHYCNVRVHDTEDQELMKHWFKTYKFILKARKHGSKVFVHCKMGVSRSASTVMAFLMKEYRWSLDKAFSFVKERRNCVRPNNGFMDQLRMYESILNASNKREIFRSRSVEQNLAKSGEEEDGEGSQQGTYLGESLFRVMSDADASTRNLTPEEEILLSKTCGNQPYANMTPDFETDSRSADSMEDSLPDMPSPLAEQAAPFPLPPQEKPAPEPRQEDGSTSPRACPATLNVEQSVASRIKHDSSWIKLEAPGESTTDPEAMDAEEADNGSVDAAEAPACKEPAVPDGGIKFEAGPSPSPPPVVSVEKGASDAETEPKEEAMSGCCEPPQFSEFELGVHQYYGREQIPWNPGTVRNLREEFSTPKPNSAPSAPSSVPLPDKPCPPKSAPKSSEKISETLPDSQPETMESCSVPAESASGVEPSSPGRESGEGEDMDVDERARSSVYEQEDIPLVPGTVQRTRQEIEQRQKLYGDDSDQSIYGIKSVKRTSSLCEERDQAIDKAHDSERRHTCTPLLSSPVPEKTPASVEGREPTMDIEASVLKLDFRIEESSTDDVEMTPAEEVEGAGNVKDVTVYTFGEECVPVKVGIVRRHKQEIENKSGDGNEARQRSLSGCSNGSAQSSDEGETTTDHPHHHHRQSPTPVSHPRAELSKSEADHRHHIPASKQSPLVQNLLSSAPAASGFAACERPGPGPTHRDFPSLEDRGGLGEERPASGSIAGGKKRGDNDHRLGRVEQGSDSLPSSASKAESLAAGSVLPAFSFHSRPCGEPKDSSVLGSVSSSSPLKSHPTSSSSSPGKKVSGKCDLDADTLAMIREIGSAFVDTRPEEMGEAEQQDCSSLVKHLVNSLERESKATRAEREIVLIDSSVEAEKKQARPSRGHPLFTPSPQFTSAISKQLFPGSEQNPFLPRQEESELSALVESKSPAEVGTGLLPCPVQTGLDGATETDRSEHPPSVVKHLRDRFEHQKSEEEAHPFTVLDAGPAAKGCHWSHSPRLQANEFGSSGVSMERDQGVGFRSSASYGAITKSRSLDEQSTGESAEPVSSFTAATHRGEEEACVLSDPSSSDLLPSSQHPRRPRSAEHVPYRYTYGIRHGGCMPRVRSPWDLDVGPGGGTGEEGCGSGVGEGVKVRRLHGKSHPLSRLQQQQQQNRGPPHSPFHSTM